MGSVESGISSAVSANLISQGVVHLINSLSRHVLERCSLYCKRNSYFIIFKIQNNEIYLLWVVVNNEAFLRHYYDFESAYAEGSSYIPNSGKAVKYRSVEMGNQMTVGNLFTSLERNVSTLHNICDVYNYIENSFS